MFLLYQKKYKTFPEEVKAGDFVLNINADFRNILRILSILADGNISDIKKADRLVNWFFDDGIPENIPVDLVTDTIINFVYANNTEENKTGLETDEEIFSNEEIETQFCYNFDAEEIYAGFLSEYGIDLIETDFLHWYKFKILLDNLSPESAFKRKIELRFMDLSGLQNSPDGGRKLAELTAAKEAAQLPARTAQAHGESQEISDFNEIWGKAGNN